MNPDAARVADFERRVDAYMKLRGQARSGLPAAKTTTSSAVITDRESDFGDRIRQLRAHARHGDIFTPPISAEFRRLARIAGEGSSARHIAVSLAHSEPVRLRLKVNGSYPSSVPLQTTPPSLLQNIPNLPKELEYRMVGRSLVLRDVGANLIVDYMHNFLP